MNSEAASLQKTLDDALSGIASDLNVKGEVWLIPSGFSGQNEIVNNLTGWKSFRTVRRDQNVYAHIGVGGLFNFEAVCAGRHDILVLLDCNIAQIFFWRDFIEMLKKTNNIEELANEMDKKTAPSVSQSLPFERVDYTCNFGGDFTYNVWLRENLDHISHYFMNSPLKNQENFDYIKKMAIEGKIVVAQMSATDEKRLAVLRKWLDDNNINVRSIYCSNILQYIGFSCEGTSLQEIVKSLEGLTNKAGTSYFYPRERGGFYSEGIHRKKQFALDVLANCPESEGFHCHFSSEFPLVVTAPYKEKVVGRWP